MAAPISVYLTDDVIAKLDEMVEAQAAQDKKAGLEGRQIMSRSKMISQLILQAEQPSTSLKLEQIQYAVVKLAEEYGAKKVSLFGSYARGDQRGDSDVDILLDKGAIKGVQVLEFQERLANELNKSVDVVTTVAASERFLKNIKGDAITIYEAA